MTTTTAPTSSALDRARELVPVLAEHAAQTESARRIHPAGLAAVRAAGFFALPLPQGFDGAASAAYVLAPVLGAALGARDATERLFASGDNRFGSGYDTIAQSPGAQHLLTEATRLTDDALARTLTWCAAIDNGEITTPLPVSQARTAFAAAVKDALAALERMLDLHGTRGMASSHPVQRLWRDASVGARHVLLNQFMIEEEYGKLLAGRSS
ncbi:MAG TPA: acyl-CoA dehydrogenase family protein [Pseudonocardiaceae bacterium]|nr:acyl-CoA dehydrogenase family protein [Pseudonocardiaceae bacterium]